MSASAEGQESAPEQPRSPRLAGPPVSLRNFWVDFLIASMGCPDDSDSVDTARTAFKAIQCELEACREFELLSECNGCNETPPDDWLDCAVARVEMTIEELQKASRAWQQAARMLRYNQDTIRRLERDYQAIVHDCRAQQARVLAVELMLSHWLVEISRAELGRQGVQEIRFL